MKKPAHGHRNRSQCRLPLQFRRTTGTVDQYRNWHSHYPLCAGKSGLDPPSLPPFGRCYSERAGESAGRQRRRAVRVRVLCSRKPPARSRTGEQQLANCWKNRHRRGPTDGYSHRRSRSLKGQRAIAGNLLEGPGPGDSGEIHEGSGAIVVPLRRGR